MSIVDFQSEPIDKLHSMIGDEVVVLFKQFKETNAEYILELINELASKDQEEVTRLAHSMKSTFASFGLMGSSRLAKDIEKNSMDSFDKVTVDNFTQLKEIFEQEISLLEEHLKSMHN